MPVLVRNRFCVSKNNNYLIAGNVCNAFALGELGAEDDFFLVGAEPQSESSYPLITGNILDSEKNLLFRIVRNVLIINPGRCSRIMGDHTGYEIRDSAGHMVFRVSTTFETLPDGSEPCYVTTLAGRFFDRNGNIVFNANSGEPEEKIETNCKGVLGFSNGGFGCCVGVMDEEHQKFASHVLATGGKVHRLLQGTIQNEKVELDGKALQNVHLFNCEVLVKDGDFALIPPNVRFEECRFRFDGKAKLILELAAALDHRS